MGREYQEYSAFNDALWTPSQKDYVKLVGDAVRGRGCASFSNEGPFHAAHIIRAFFIRATSEVRIFSGRLRTHGELENRENAEGDPPRKMKIYADGRILSAVGAFLADKGTKLRIVVEEEELDGGTENHPLVKKLNALQDDNKLRGSCKIASLPEAEKTVGRLHMVVMDRAAYRLETDHDKAEALVGFGDDFVAGRLIDVFDKSLWSEDRLLWSNAPATE